MDDILVIVQEQDTIIVEIGAQGPVGPKGNPGSGHHIFDTTEDMFANPGDPGDTTYCVSNPDQWYKWSVSQNTWLPASI